jgi:hypothetical protein
MIWEAISVDSVQNLRLFFLKLKGFTDLNLFTMAVPSQPAKLEQITPLQNPLLKQ